MGKPQRDRVTIDLRGLREPLQTRAVVNQMTPAALVRQAVLAYLAPKSGDQTLTFPHNFRLQNNSLRSRLAVQKQCMGACMVG